MIDAVKLLKEVLRMCKETGRCEDCPIYTCCAIDTGAFEVREPEKAVEIIEEWVAEHPRKTRQSEFLKRFPNARLECGIVCIDPCEVDKSIGEDTRCENITCGECAEKYWLEEV